MSEHYRAFQPTDHDRLYPAYFTADTSTHHQYAVATARRMTGKEHPIVEHLAGDTWAQVWPALQGYPGPKPPGHDLIVPREAELPANTSLPVDEIRTVMETGVHHDYDAQEWRDGADHVHVFLATSGPHIVRICGADLASCQPVLWSCLPALAGRMLRA